MGSDPVVTTVARKELRLFFASPVAWLFLASFAAANGFIVFWVESFFARNIADIRPLFEWMPVLLIFLCAALTMRAWSEERSRGTIEHILTQPHSPWPFVAGKFCACFTLLGLAVVLTLPLPFTVALIANLDWGPVLGGYAATLMLGGMYLTIGLYISALSDNSVVSLIATVMLCSVLYLSGSPDFTAYFSDHTGNMLRMLGSAARFDAITRGVLDLRDVIYYVSIGAGFLALNVYALESLRCYGQPATIGLKRKRRITLLLIANLFMTNLWLSPLDTLRLDTTEGKLYSVSPATSFLLKDLQEPLLIRGYFSSKTHPLLAPLVPQIQDLLQEYEIAGNGKVIRHIVDPAADPSLEREANEIYGISSTPFRIADRHQASLVNAYFNVLVRYGNEFRSLRFTDLIEVRAVPNTPTEVLLRNPEYQITNAIRQVVTDYISGGRLFDGIKEPVEFIGYVSKDALLPLTLRAYKRSIEQQLALAADNSEGKLSVRFIEPEARDGDIARRIRENWGFKPMVAQEGAGTEFYFYLTLATSEQVVQLPAGEFNPANFRLALDAGLKRFATGFNKVVALSLPPDRTGVSPLQASGPVFTHLERALSREYSLRQEDLSDGTVAADADILAVIAPRSLGSRALFAIDQFLMRGGTVVLVTAPFSASITAGKLQLNTYTSGLQGWLAHHGINIEESVVLDSQNASFTVPVTRLAGDYEFQDAELRNYPYFIDLRPPGLIAHPVTRNLPQLTMPWASPIVAKPAADTQITPLLQSSSDAWLSSKRGIMPTAGTGGAAHIQPPAGDGKTYTLGLLMNGRFSSFFREGNPGAIITGDFPSANLLEHSAESARIVLYASNDFMSDEILQGIVAASSTQYLGSLELMLNSLDWAMRDEQLLGIRSRGHFNRTLPPMERRMQKTIEYTNYALALLLLAVMVLGSWLNARQRRRRYSRGLLL